MTSATVSRWSRAFVAAGVGWFVLAQLTVLAGAARSTFVVLGLYGFVFHVVFGKAYSLVPSYFDRELACPRAVAIHLPFASGGTTALALGTNLFGASVLDAPVLEAIGAVAWLWGVLVFVAALGWTIRDNPTGGETGTGGANAHRERVDRVANAAVPLVLGYMLVAAAVPVLDLLFDLTGADAHWLPAGPALTHLLTAGAGALLVFAVGFRLLPRFFVTTPRTALVGIVLPAGALGPAVLAGTFYGGVGFRVGATLLALAVVTFAVAIFDMYARSDRRRVGFNGVLVGSLAGIAAVSIGLHTAFAGAPASPDILEVHVRLALVGFLGLTIVGVSYQFYPPAIGQARGVGNRTALASIALVFGGLLLELVGTLVGVEGVVRAGHVAGAAGAIAYAFVVYSLFLERRR